MRALGIAATGMGAQQAKVDTIANNIANSSTTGYKAGRATFSDLIYQEERRAGAATSADGTMAPVGIDIGLGVRQTGVIRDASQGTLQETGQDLSMAINGRGYFIINRPDGTVAYTRDGNFGRSPDGEIVTNDGYQLSPGLVIPEDATEIEISATGLVTAYTGNEVEPVELGQLTLATFINDAGLRPVGDNLFEETDASGAPVELEPGEDHAGLIRQRYIEESNVDPIREMTELIKSQRTYELGSKSMTTADQMMQTVNQIR